jgi:CRISPR/Cas system-associated exonuclease Cas4 (RecB family)
MKTIEISDELFEKLKYLSNEIKTQDNRGTASPYFFQISTEKFIPTDDSIDFDKVTWYNYGQEKELESDYESQIQYLKEEITDLDTNTIQECDGFSDDNDFGNLDNDCTEEDVELLLRKYIDEDNIETVLENIGFHKFYLQKIQILENVFLTEKSIRTHIENNVYHYANPKTYVSYAYRNPDMETIFEFLNEIK